MKAITPLEIQFDAGKIMQTMPADILGGKEFKDVGQLSITHTIQSNSWFDSVGSLYDYSARAVTRFTKDYTVLNSHFKGTYLEEVIDAVKAQAASDGVLIGRIRLMQLKAKCCYTYHIDDEDFRYHIPLITNEKNFFVVSDVVSRMPEIGQLYRFKTNEIHTAVNASFRDRYHLLFDTY